MTSSLRYASFVLLAVLASIALWTAAFHVGVALADTPAAVGAGSNVAAPAPQPALHDVTQDPIGFVQDMRDLWHKGGWAWAVMLGVVGLLELAAYLGKDNAKLAWLGKGRISLAIGAGTALLMTVLNVLLDGGAWSAALVAGAGALLAYWHQAGTDPAKS